MNTDSEKPFNIQERTFSFAQESLQIYTLLKKSDAPLVLCTQFIKASTSIGANCKEAHHGETKKDFIHKLSIARKEAGECLYWISLLKDTVPQERKVELLEKECEEIFKIISKIILNTQTEK